LFPAVKGNSAEWQRESRDVSDASTFKVLNVLSGAGQCISYWYLLRNLGGEWSCLLSQRGKKPSDRENRAALLKFSW